MSTRQTVSGTGSLQNVVLEFPYINQSHVKVEVGGVPLAYTWVNPTTIRFTAGAGQQVTIYRDTPNDGPLVVFGTVNSVGADDLNLATKQALFVAQEFGDVADLAVSNGLASKADLNHTHSTATSSTAGFMSATDKVKLDAIDEVVQDIVGSALQAGPNISVVYNDDTGKITLSATGTLSADWNTLANRPASFTPSTHTHSTGDVTGLSTTLTDLQTQINGKAATSHSHAISDVTGLQSALDGKFNSTGGTISQSLTVGTAGGGHSVLLRRFGTTIGGTLQFEVPSTGSTLNGPVRMRVNANSVEIGEEGGAARGVNIDLTTAATAAGSTLIHSGNLGAQLAAMPVDSIGSYGLFFHPANATTAVGTVVSGSVLLWTNNLSSAGAPPGQWVRQGLGNAANNYFTLYKRVA